MRFYCYFVVFLCLSFIFPKVSFCTKDFISLLFTAVVFLPLCLFRRFYFAIIVVLSVDFCMVRILKKVFSLDSFWIGSFGFSHVCKTSRLIVLRRKK